MSLARATVSGIVIEEPEKRFTQNNNAVSNFVVEVTPSRQNDPSFLVKVVCWGKLAESIDGGVLTRGTQVVIEGRLQVHQHDTGGFTKRAYEIEASNVYLGHLQPLDTGSGRGGNNFNNNAQNSGIVPPQQPAQPQPAAVGAGAQAPQDNFSSDDLLTEDDIPF